MAAAAPEVLGYTLLSISLLFLGTWPALLRLASTSSSSVQVPAWLDACVGYTSQQQHCGTSSGARDTRFAYLDYALSYVISSSLPLLAGMAWEILMQGRGTTTTPEQSPSSTIFIVFALIGGSFLSIGNLSMQWATTNLGAPLTTVLAIQASLTVTVGTTINYCLTPTATTRPDYLAAGVVVFVAAIILATRAHLIYGQQQQQQAKDNTSNNKNNSITDSSRSSTYTSASTASKGLELLAVQEGGDHSYGSLESNDSLESMRSLEDGTTAESPVLLLDGTTKSLSSTNTATTTDTERSPHLALIVTVLGGLCFGFFSPAMNVAVNDPFHWSADSDTDADDAHLLLQPLTVSMANLWFSLAFCLASFAGNLPLMYHPPAGAGLVATTFSNYLACPWPERRLALTAGLICGWANLLQFQGGNLVGFATADLVQAFPLISTMWDIGLFGEYRQAKSTVLFYLIAMYALYLCGVGFLITSTMGHHTAVVT